MAARLIVSGQSIRTEYGKNRVQYHDDFSKWWEYETENFFVYWYGKGLNVAQSAIQIAEANYPSIQNLVEHRINDKIEIIVYVDLADLKQSNIGIQEIFETRHERTKVIGSKIFVHFDGNHQHLERRIREGIAEVFFNSMYHAGGLQEVVTSDPELDLPNWYRQGFVSFAGGGWDYLMEDEMRDLWYRNKAYQSFDRLASDYPRVAGHTLWHFLAEEYGQTSITTLLYLMRLRNELDENVEFIFGFNFKKLKRDWAMFYRAKYGREEGVFTSSDTLPSYKEGFSRWFPKSQFRISPDGSKMIYTVNREGRAITHLLDIVSGNKERIFTAGSLDAVQQPDYNYPIVCWHPSRPEITLAIEFQDVIRLIKIDLETMETIEQDIPENIQRIYNIDYISDDEYMMNGAINGYSELFSYRARSRNVKQITKDYYDDMDASYVNIGGQWGILFASNRPTPDIFPVELDTSPTTLNFDLFFLPDGADLALKLTNTPDVHEEQPRLINGHFISYLSSFNGIKNRWVLDLNSRRAPYQHTNLDRNIINHDGVVDDKLIVYQSYVDGTYRLFMERPNWNESRSAYYTTASQAVEFLEQQNAQEPSSSKGVKSFSKFISRFPDPDVLEPLESNARFKLSNKDFITVKKKNLEQKLHKFIPSQAVASRRKFKLEEISLRADNSILFEGLESYTGRDPTTEIQEPGVLAKAVAKDMYEDFGVQMGIRLPFDFRGSELFAIYDDRRKRIDRRISIYRQQKSMDFPFGNIVQRERSITTLGQYRLSYPFDTYRSVRATGMLRQDRLFFLNSDPTAYEAPRINEQRASIRLEYIYDNTLGVDLNLIVGSRYKFYTEVINRFDLRIFDGFSFMPNTGFTAVFGFDARHYLPVLRHSILAFRGAGASSLGSDKVLYFVGGTDGWLAPQFNDQVSVPQGDNFAFRTNAPNLRGFNNNTRNGRTFFLGSTELRIPIFKYFSRSELKSKFLRNVQLVGFVDGGSAWHGWLPNKGNNPLNTVTINSTPGVSVLLDLGRSNFIYSYGVGMRINLLGYFVRADYGWGVDGGFVDQPKLHISLGTDF